MTIEQKLKDLICERYGSIFEFSKKLEMANSTLNSILNRGVQKASIGNIIKICEELEISADELANDRIVFVNKQTQTYDIENIIDFARMNMSTFTLKLDEKELSSIEMKYIIDSLSLTVEFIRRTRKEEV